jgi:AraC family transcriptional regulator
MFSSASAIVAPATLQRIPLPSTAAPIRNDLKRPSSYAGPWFSAVHLTVSSPIGRHVHDEYFVGFHFSGSSVCTLPGKSSLEFGPGDLGFIRPGTVHEDAPLDDPVEYLALRILPNHFNKQCAAFGGDHIIPAGRCSKIRADAHLTADFHALRSELVNKPPGYEMAAACLVTEIMIHLFRQLIPNGSADRDTHGEEPMHDVRWQVRRALQYVQAHYDEDFDLASTAAAVGISKYYLVRLFRSSMGLTLNTYLLQLRVEKAKELLLTPSRTISDVAMELGFSDQSHFARVFKRFTGLTPLAYRQGAR